LIGNLHYMLGFGDEMRDWPRARRSFAAAAAASPDNDVLFYNLGLIFARNGFFEEAIAAFQRSQEINPRHLATQSRPRAEDRLRELAAERRRLEALRADLEADPRLRGADRGSPAYHVRLADLFEDRGERSAARAERLRAQEVETRAQADRGGGSDSLRSPSSSR
jgi:tetratricopeptide (TPR) repeat protein